MTETLRLCLDLNIWCAALLASVKGREGTSCQTLVDIVRQGSCLARKVELVISWGMLNRLQEVLENRPQFQVLQDDAVFYLEVIRSYAQYRGEVAARQFCRLKQKLAAFRSEVRGRRSEVLRGRR